MDLWLVLVFLVDCFGPVFSETACAPDLLGSGSPFQHVCPLHQHQQAEFRRSGCFPVTMTLAVAHCSSGFCCRTLDGPGLELQIKWTVTEARGSALVVTATNQWPRYYVLLDTTGLHRQING